MIEVAEVAAGLILFVPELRRLQWKVGMRTNKSTKTIRVPVVLWDRYQEITALTDSVCKECLTDEYEMLCRDMTAAICRLTSTPIESGRASIWASGIAFAVARINFAFDDPDGPQITRNQLCERFRANPRTSSERASTIMKLLKAVDGDPRWWCPSRMENNPRAWYVRVDGIFADIRNLPEDLQQKALQKKLVPYIPPPRTGYRNTNVESEMMGRAFRSLLPLLKRIRIP